VGGLQRVPPLEAPAAAGARADVDVELADEGASWDLGLILGLDLRFHHGAATVRASLGQGSLEDLIDRLGPGGKRWPWADPALRPGRLGCGLGGPLEKGAAWRLAWRRAWSRSARAWSRSRWRRSFCRRRRSLSRRSCASSARSCCNSSSPQR